MAKAIPVNTKGFIIKASTNKINAIKPVQTYQEGNPSLYKTNMKTL